MKTKIDVKYVAHLARINLSKEETKSFERQFTDILSHMEKLSKLDTANVPPTSHILPVKNVFREDRVRESLSAEKSLANAPQKEGKLFKVPKIVEEA